MTLRSSIEAVLLVCEEAQDVDALARATEAAPADVQAACEDLAAEYDTQGRGFALRQTDGCWRLYTRPEYAPVVERFVLDGRQARLSQAALETLAVVAYSQPVSRGRVAAVRAVNVDGVIRTLLNRGLAAEVGHDEHSGAMLYGTTTHFLERLGLSSLADLPEMAPLLPELADLDADA